METGIEALRNVNIPGSNEGQRAGGSGMGRMSVALIGAAEQV
jgi:hypothetical protein